MGDVHEGGSLSCHRDIDPIAECDDIKGAEAAVSAIAITGVYLAADAVRLPWMTNDPDITNHDGSWITRFATELRLRKASGISQNSIILIEIEPPKHSGDNDGRGCAQFPNLVRLTHEKTLSIMDREGGKPGG